MPCLQWPTSAAWLLRTTVSASVDIEYLGEVRTDGSCEDTYTLTRTWRATDCAGNVHEQSQTIEVQDTTSPDAYHRLPG